MCRRYFRTDGCRRTAWRRSWSDEEIVATCSLVLFGGHETTTNLISSSTHALLRNPEQMKKLRNDPSLITTAVEEFLRYDGPSKAMVRIALEDCELRGKPIKKGQRLLLMQSAANHDPERFDNPDRLDISPLVTASIFV
jgi:cytochrome P450